MQGSAACYPWRDFKPWQMFIAKPSAPLTTHSLPAVAERLNLPVSAVRIPSGQTSRNSVSIAGVTHRQVLDFISPAPPVSKKVKD
jgi:hypothetical protein